MAFHYVRKLAGSIFALLSILSAARAQTWTSVGNPGFSTGEVTYPSIAIDANGNPYVAYVGYVNGNKATVMEYNGSTWLPTGTTGFSAGQINYISMAMDANGVPYVVYQDGVNGAKATVMKDSSSIWVAVGSTAFSPAKVGFTSTSIVIDASGTPYIAYFDAASDQVAVMKYNGTAWVTLFTTPDLTSTFSIAVDGTGTPYLAYADSINSYKATVIKYNGTSWVMVGSAGFSTIIANANEQDYLSIAIDGAGTPYLAYTDDISSKAFVMKFNGSSWVTVGSAGVSTGAASATSIAIDANEVPYIAYTDGANADKATVMKYDGTNWVTVGNANFTLGGAYYTRLAISDTTLYVSYQDANNNNKATVMKYVLPLSVNTVNNLRK